MVSNWQINNLLSISSVHEEGNENRLDKYFKNFNPFVSHVYHIFIMANIQEESLIMTEGINDGESSTNETPTRKRTLSVIEEQDEPNEKQHYKRFKITSEEENFKWTLPEGMSTYANELFDKFIPDREVKEAVTVPHPCPSNINQVRKLDDFLEDILREKKKTQELNMESVLEKTQKKLLDVMGPLSRVWLAFDKAKDGGDQEDVPTVEELLQHTEQTILLIGQTSNFLTYERRKNALSCLYTGSQVSSTLKEKSDILKEKDINLFGKPFRDHFIEAMKAKKESLKAFVGDSFQKSNNQSPVALKANSSSGSRGPQSRMPFRQGPPPARFSRRGGGQNSSNYYSKYNKGKDSFRFKR